MKQPSNLLHVRIAELIGEVKSRCPEARVEISYQPYETEDAHLRVHCPDSWDLDQCEDLGMAMASIYTRILLDDGLSILVLIIEPPERVREEMEALQRQRQQKAS